MGSPPIDPAQPRADAISPLLEPALLSDALALAGAYAFEMGEDGYLDVADRSRLEHKLVERPGTLDTSRNGWNARLSDADARARISALEGLSYVGARYRLDYALRDGAGETRHIREIAECLACSDGRATLLRGVLIDRTEDAQSDAAIAWRARHDSLTRLPNRAALQDAGMQLSALGERIGIPVHMLRLRLPNLDTLAANFGENLRDRLLREAGARLQAALRAPDMVARLGGADFAAATLNSDPDTLGLRLRAAVTAEPYATPFGPLALELESARAPLGTVEAALETTRHTLDGTKARAPIAPDLPSVEDAIETDRLSLAFQPIVHAADHRLHHFEALLRLQGSDGRMASAFPFIVQAEASGQVHWLDRHVLGLATEALRKDDTLRLAVNVSAGTVGDAEHSAAYIAALSALGPLAERLTLELTETLAVDDPALASRFSAEVRALGCRFAVDDFASGHTSFRNLLAVEADCIKIDGSLVRGVALDENKQAFIRVMVDLAATFGVETVAEMVEDRADAAVLARLGTTYLQGYHFGKPGPKPVWDGPQSA
ncbi:MAG: bifunctional diguanylate cyclase/phosphodiesterase [Pseudomonadota bacterium]